MQRRSCAAMGWLAALVWALLLAAPARADTSGMQRMILAAGCYDLPPAASCDAAAFCLDQARAAPPAGSRLATAPAGFGKAVVKVNGGAPLSLQAALDRHLVSIEGLGEHLRLRLRNLTHDRIAICFTAPMVVMGNGETYTGDLPATYDRMVKLLAAPSAAAAAGSTADSVEAARARLQQRLWDVVNDADAKANEALSRQIFEGTLYAPPTSPPPVVMPNSARCADRMAAAVVCTGQ
ncbi:MAG TPA: hypothetical protein VKY65_07930 [Alphaproteobacteria bacterium]|nr:hypothetical protein [Alphaproteobacteria bacterium]